MNDKLGQEIPSKRKTNFKQVLENKRSVIVTNGDKSAYAPLNRQIKYKYILLLGNLVEPRLNLNIMDCHVANLFF